MKPALPLPTVKFDEKWITSEIKEDAMKALLQFPETAEPTPQMYEAALETARGNLSQLFPLLLAAGASKSRASEICRTVGSRLSSLIDRDRGLALGVKEAEWIYSGAPCIASPKKPLPNEELRDAEHRAANGKRYRLADGFLMNGRHVRPGEEPGCKCRARHIIAF